MKVAPAIDMCEFMVGAPGLTDQTDQPVGIVVHQVSILRDFTPTLFQRREIFNAVILNSFI
jgi:hypothetical protein